MGWRFCDGGRCDKEKQIALVAGLSGRNGREFDF